MSRRKPSATTRGFRHRIGFVRHLFHPASHFVSFYFSLGEKKGYEKHALNLPLSFSLSPSFSVQSTFDDASAEVARKISPSSRKIRETAETQIQSLRASFRSAYLILSSALCFPFSLFARKQAR